MSKQSFKDRYGAIIGVGVMAVAMIIGIKVVSGTKKTTEDTAAQEILKEATPEQQMQGSAEQQVVVQDDLATKILKEQQAKTPSAAAPTPAAPAPAAPGPAKAEPPKQAAAPTPPPAPPAPTAEENQVCTPADRALDRPWCKGQGINLVSIQPSQQPVRQQGGQGADYGPPDPPPGSEASKHPLLKWKELGSEKLEVTQGRQSMYTDRVIRAGCRVLGTLEDGMIVTQGGKPHDFTINVRGALDGCTLPETEGIRLVGQAEMDNLGRYITATITRCSDRNPKRKTVKCESARVKSITGADMLEGQLYDQSGWGIFIESMLALGMTPAVSKLIETASSAKTIFQAATAAAIADRLQETLTRVSQKISATFEGKEIHTPEGVMVIVLFKEDVIL